MYPPPPAPPKPKASTFVKHGEWMVCTTCKLAAPYCACHRQPAPDAPPKDGVDSTLNARERELKR